MILDLPVSRNFEVSICESLEASSGEFVIHQKASRMKKIILGDFTDDDGKRNCTIKPTHEIDFKFKI